MYGTCPSKGTNKIFAEMTRVGENWPSAYFVVTDGRISHPDRERFSRAIGRLKWRLKKSSGMRACAATIGYATAQDINKRMKTSCIFAANDFKEVAQAKFASDFGDMVTFKNHASSMDESVPGGYIGYVPPKEGDGDTTVGTVPGQRT
jgi:hypothetical protein